MVAAVSAAGAIVAGIVACSVLGGGFSMALFGLAAFGTSAFLAMAFALQLAVQHTTNGIAGGGPLEKVAVQPWAKNDHILAHETFAIKYLNKI